MRGRLKTLTGIVAASTALGGCGTAKPLSALTGTEVAHRAGAAAAAARSYRLAGVLSQYGVTEHFTVDLLSSGRGTGTATIGGTRIRVVVTRTTVYRQRAGRLPFAAPALRRLARSWIREPVSGSGSLQDLLKAVDALRRGEAGRNLGVFNTAGVRVVRVAIKGGTLDVADAGIPYPVFASGRTHGVQLRVTFSRWNRVVRIRLPRHSITAAAAARRLAHLGSSGSVPQPVLQSTATVTNGGERFSAPGYGLHFDYPSGLRPVTLQPSRGVLAGQSHTAIGLGERDLIIVTRFPHRPIPVTPRDVTFLLPEYEAAVARLAGHSVRGHVARLGGHPAMEFPAFTSSVDGAVVHVQVNNVFAGETEYEIACQSSVDTAQIDQACAEALRTVSVGS